MDFINDIKSGISKLSQNTKKSFDITKIEYKLKSYSYEAEETYKAIGKIVYEGRDNNIDANLIESLFKDLDSINNRIKSLERNKNIIKHDRPRTEKSIIEQGGSANYAKLNKKSDDLTIKRTEEGIKILRFCPKCHTENSSSAKECTICKYVFKTSDEN